jgi:single-strand DNA-binding protein
MYHKVIIAGYLGRDPEMRYTSAGTPVTNFSVATSRRWTGQDGEQRDETIWWRVSVWGRQAEVANEYLFKGRPVLVEGTMVPDPQTGGPRLWTGQDGQVRASYEIRADTVRFLGSRTEAAPGAPAGAQDAIGEEEVPF